MKLSLFDYELPKWLIAQAPAQKRTGSRLMVVKGGVEHKVFSDLPDYLKAGDVLVINDTKVMDAQIDAKKSSGGKIKLMISGKAAGGYACKIKGHGVRKGDEILLPDKTRARVESVVGTDFILSFSGDIDTLLRNHGRVPLPPYIKGSPPDLSRYQTVYAKDAGSLAAPTAGLHFSDELMGKIEKIGVKFARVTLHVSFATFDRVKVDDVEKHVMHPEFYTVTKEAADTINNRGGRLIVVGTTSLKTIESASDAKGRVIAQSASSKLFIYPGYVFKTKPDAMITNFHLPKSTLLMLVSAYYRRERMLELYKEAISENYRFFSFGDAMLLFRE